MLSDTDIKFMATVWRIPFEGDERLLISDSLTLSGVEGDAGQYLANLAQGNLGDAQSPAASISAPEYARLAGWQRITNTFLYSWASAKDGIPYAIPYNPQLDESTREALPGELRDDLKMLLQDDVDEGDLDSDDADGSANGTDAAIDAAIDASLRSALFLSVGMPIVGALNEHRVIEWDIHIRLKPTDNDGQARFLHCGVGGYRSCSEQILMLLLTSDDALDNIALVPHIEESAEGYWRLTPGSIHLLFL